MRTALLVIDFQNAVFSPPAVYQGELMQARIAHLIARARASGTPVIFVQHHAAGTDWEAGGVGWHFPVAIAPQPGDHVSAKTACDAFRDTDLERHLSRQGVTRLLVCGAATEFCVDTSVRRAASLELQVVVVADAHTTRDRPHMKAERIIEHHNWIWAGLDVPGNPITLCQSADVHFAPQP